MKHKADDVKYSDKITKNLSGVKFRSAFSKYCTELGFRVTDWDALFDEIACGEENELLLRSIEGGEVIGFVLFRPETFSSNYFEETCGFIREFWVEKFHRRRGHGTELLKETENYFLKQGVGTVVLTTNSAGKFYMNRGYEKAPFCKAKNGYEVYVKKLK